MSESLEADVVALCVLCRSVWGERSSEEFRGADLAGSKWSGEEGCVLRLRCRRGWREVAAVVPQWSSISMPCLGSR